ncbi:DUF3078 domain-containing protein [Flavobacterium sp. GT3R68]|uniref:DUF3078 domain-containing protein n=1 Tax=Flavobacterium sp. GT3R68 TaxID=2594437 RepID=UPI000F88B09D|nr:DUF3078 domain-containing protein [Flavobacterium sp. GT3R68]RTY95845.1 DUF3078 domain-containing protein [Flavobacterium sp. GSN2]TRW93617.1 DUF3078 domain-containing protein [Flavobacterium sp. GT3R68]
MKKTAIILLCIFGTITAKAQEEVKPDTTKVWTCKGNFILLFNQSTFSHWTAGGVNNLSGNVGVNYDCNYKKDDWSWDNKILASYGVVKTKSALEKKTDDRFEFNSLLGKKAKGYWYYSAFLNFRTQMTKGYVYKTELGVETREPRTNLLSPGYLTFGPGMLWKKDDNLKFNIAPLTSKFTFVDPDFTLPNKAYFGVEEGNSMRYELGFYAAGYYKFMLMANVSLENILNVYSNYLDKPQVKKTDVDYQLNVKMKINRYLSTNLAFQTIHDLDAYDGWQTRQVFGAGVNFDF